MLSPIDFVYITLAVIIGIIFTPLFREVLRTSLIILIHFINATWHIVALAGVITGGILLFKLM